MTTEYCFLLGAGASVPAGIPTMNQLYELFLEILTQEELEFINQLETVLDRHRDDENSFNLESILRILNLINRVDKEPIQSFFCGFKDGIENNLDLVGPMIKKLKGLIREECVTKERNIEYILPLIKFIHEADALQIFTLNYDLIIEILCELYRLKYTDGFNFTWEPKLLENDRKYDLRLYKLHGSIIWHRTQEGKSLKIPIINYEGELKYFLGSELSNMLVYPEENKQEPFQRLLKYFDLELLEKRLLISIGYSFCDALIRQRVLDGLKDNPKLHIYLICPNAQEILEKYFSNYRQRVTVFNQGIKEMLTDDSLYFKLKEFLKSNN
ncbi:SIR2 family protein [Selenihalanaerobacter shriftii]|uniref:SIR2-like domain-containing protein n=1 Tax=Selenihalanaerobacter shriftii TaxID=142842 RepID=A0A1T4JYT5_9FIRM|nr:SIR2 family protein [Selenihalanaerobacter shriftii]SJZ35350.1 SIR2-like domain-containing protein [Selenihalanaerobacter shriftii]